MFKDLAGNPLVKAVLRRMLEHGRVPGALIFAGDDGIGKRQFALEFARAVLCLSPRDFQACGGCGACVRARDFVLPRSHDKDENEKIFWSEHPDIGLIRPAGKFITVKQIREIETEANFRPFQGKARFFLVDEADRMNESASNALLKTLEEPPATSHLVLLTARPNSLLQTIRSRCQIIRFAPLKTDEIEHFLGENKQVSPNDVKLTARLSAGSIGKALALNVDAYKQQREMMLGVVEALTVAKDRAHLLKIAEELNEAKLKDEYETCLEVLATLIHDVWRLRLGAEDSVNADLQPKLVKFAENIESSQAQAWLSEIETLREQFLVNVNRKIATDALFMRMASV